MNTTIFGPALNILGDLFLIFVYYSFYAPYLLVILNIRQHINKLFKKKNVFLRVNDIKTGALVGIDKYGNKYYEDNRQFFGMSIHTFAVCTHIHCFMPY